MSITITPSGKGRGKLGISRLILAILFFIMALFSYIYKESLPGTVDIAIKGTVSFVWIFLLFISMGIVIYDLLK